MNVVISIPAWNEEKTLPKVLKEIKTVMAKSNYKYQILVVDDGSKDKTSQVAKKAGAVVVKKRHSGLLETFKREMEECLKMKVDVVVHTDADGQYPAKHILDLLKEIDNGYDLVLGSRFAGEIESMPIMKWLGNVAFAKVFTRLCKTKITDSTTGFRAFTRDVIEGIEYNTSFTYTQEQLIKASRMNFKIKEIPISARKTRESRLMKGAFDYAMKAWINIFRIYRDFSPLAFFGKIGLVFLTVGLLIGLYSVYTLLLTGNVGGIPRVVLSTLLIMTGVQVILFGFLADMKN
jgi:glycosyltransferase involved in cell wall biosynthesis